MSERITTGDLPPKEVQVRVNENQVFESVSTADLPPKVERVEPEADEGWERAEVGPVVEPENGAHPAVDLVIGPEETAPEPDPVPAVAPTPEAAPVAEVVKPRKPRGVPRRKPKGARR